MEEERSGTRKRPPNLGSHFIVELAEEAAGSFAICERIMVVRTDENGVLSPEFLKRMFAGPTLRALPIPTSEGRLGEGLSDSLGRAQSADNRIHLTINNNVRNNDRDDDKS